MDASYITKKDKEILRLLGKQVAEIAAESVQQEKRKLWYALNSLKEVRPLVICDPENGWEEIITYESLLCESYLGREWEFALRRELFYGKSMGDDKVVEPVFNVAHVYTKSDWGMHEVRRRTGEGGSFTWDAPIKDYNQLGLLHFPEIDIDSKSTEERLALAGEIFDGYLDVRLYTRWWWTLGLTQTLAFLRGLEQIMYDMYDYPDELHRLMAFLRDGTLAELDYLENSGLLFLNNKGHGVGSGGFGYTDELPKEGFNPNKVRAVDMWGFCESQETTSISPEMFEEFVFPYQYPILERFGLNCYGCCEPLDNRWEVVKKFPNLRRISVSPWADRAAMAEKLQNKYVYSMKPSPSVLAMPVADEDEIRSSIRAGLKAAKGCRVEIIMKDNHTIGKNPQNVINWCRIAKEEAESI